MRRSAAFGVLISVWASGAAAQTTECADKIIGMPSAGVVCHTTGSSPSTPVDWRNSRPVPCSKFDLLALPDTVCSARQVAANRKAVGDLIAAGKCDEGLKGALGTGDLQFAREVRDFCAGK